MSTEMERVVFTKEMKETHTILIPMMLPIHFKMLSALFNQQGYHTELLYNDGRSVVDEGLRNVHNDTCYPALLVIGQMLDALASGKYDPHKVAFLITQTGGGCRASNYIHLLRKALKKSGYGYIPVISLNLAGLEKNPGFELPPAMLMKLAYAVIVGDFLMLLNNQCRPYEANPGDTGRVVEHYCNYFAKWFASARFVRYQKIRAMYPEILEAFDKIPKKSETRARVGIVGEIYVKYSPLGNNHLEEFLISEGAEPVVPGLLDFCLYCVYNGIVDHELYGTAWYKNAAMRFAYRFLLKKQMDMINAVREYGVFDAPTPFARTNELANEIIHHGVKMGEGWLLTAEMMELIESGVNNIVCTQPFGCLPNHIVGKGMMHAIKEKRPGANIVAIDYDPGASEVNQQNRIKLMLANARLAEQMTKQEENPAAGAVHAGKEPAAAQ